MDRIEFVGWTMDCDVDATRLAYAGMSLGGPEECGCLHCRNFAAARPQLYPSAALTLFERLGIDSTRETEVYYLAPDGSDADKPPEMQMHLYGGWFHAIGDVVTDREEYEVSQDFQLTIIPGGAVIPPSFPDTPLFRIEFSVHVPWVLPERFAG
jgi:hypothetical protein